MDFVLSSKAKRFTMILMVLGLVFMGLEFVVGHTGEEDHFGTRVWSNLLINGFFFFAIAIADCCFLFLLFFFFFGYIIFSSSLYLM